MVENEDLRRILLSEMDTADQNLQDLETQFLEMPNPFAEEVTELREGLEANHRVMNGLSDANWKLETKLAQEKAAAAKTIDTLEKKLAFSIEMLNKVKEMETFKLIKDPKILDALDADGDGDVEWDEALPQFRALGMTEAEARELFDRLDTSGDGTISAEEFAAFKKELAEMDE